MIKKFLTKKSKIRIYIIYFEDALLYNYLLKNVNTKYYNKRLEGVYMKLNENINNIQNQDILQGLSKEEVDKRIKEGNYNKAVDSVSKTIKEARRVRGARHASLLLGCGLRKAFRGAEALLSSDGASLRGAPCASLSFSR